MIAILMSIVAIFLVFALGFIAGAVKENYDWIKYKLPMARAHWEAIASDPVLNKLAAGIEYVSAVEKGANKNIH